MNRKETWSFEDRLNTCVRFFVTQETKSVTLDFLGITEYFKV
jgi:hypothetical protein